MMTVIVATIFFAIAMVGLAIGVIFKRRGLRGPCCGKHVEADRGGASGSCGADAAPRSRQPHVQISLENLKRN